MPPSSHPPIRSFVLRQGRVSNAQRRAVDTLSSIYGIAYAPGACVHAATDWQEYAEQILAVFAAEPALVNTAPGFAPRPDYRPLTKFESRGLKLGHGVWDIIFRRI